MGKILIKILILINLAIFASEQKITYVHCSKKQNGEEIKFRGKIIRVYETGIANYRQQEVFVIRLLNNKTIRYRGFCREVR